MPEIMYYGPRERLLRPCGAGKYRCIFNEVSPERVVHECLPVMSREAAEGYTF